MEILSESHTLDTLADFHVYRWKCGLHILFLSLSVTPDVVHKKAAVLSFDVIIANINILSIMYIRFLSIHSVERLEVNSLRPRVRARAHARFRSLNQLYFPFEYVNYAAEK